MRSLEPINGVLASFMAGEEHHRLLSELRREFPRIPDADVEEWLSESYIAGLRKCDANDPSAVYVFLRRSARNFILKHLDRKEQSARSDNPDFDFDAQESRAPTPEQLVLAAERRRLAAEAMAQLAPRTQTVVYLRVIEELRRPTIAQRLGLSAKSVKKELERGIATLRADFRRVAGPACESAWDERVGSYAFRLLDPTEQRIIEAHLTECAICRDYHRNLRSMAAAAAAAVPAPLTAGTVGGGLPGLADALRHPVRAARRALGQAQQATASSSAGSSGVSAASAVAGKLVPLVVAAGALGGTVMGAHAVLTPEDTRGDQQPVASPVASPGPNTQPRLVPPNQKAVTSLSGKRARHRRHRRHHHAAAVRPRATPSPAPTPGPAPAPTPAPAPKPHPKSGGASEFF